MLMPWKPKGGRRGHHDEFLVIIGLQNAAESDDIRDQLYHVEQFCREVHIFAVDLEERHWDKYRQWMIRKELGPFALSPVEFSNLLVKIRECNSNYKMMDSLIKITEPRAMKTRLILLLRYCVENSTPP